MPVRSDGRRLAYQAAVVRRRRAGSRVLYRVADEAATEICRTVSLQIAARIDAGAPLRIDLPGFALDHPAGGKVPPRTRPHAG